MKRISMALLLLTGAAANPLSAQNPLFIPDTLSGTVFNLTAQTGTVQFVAGPPTPTFGFNGNILGPTLLMNAGDSVELNVTNSLNVPTTVHWHGFHIPAKFDGGPHQIINPNTTWKPSFKIRNNAATYWYHPHGEGKTEIHVAKGLAGLIIIRDSIEKTYALPRRYKVDDFPLILQTKTFDFFNQVLTATHEDSIPMVNATIDPYLQVPKQVCRFRVLAAASDRTFYLGLSDSSTFYVIASDGGMLAQPFATTRLRMSIGERYEILIDFSADSIGQQKYLMSYASELPHGIIGADSVGVDTIQMGEGYYDNPLNGADFNLLRFDVIAATANPVLTIPSSFAPVTPIPTSSATVSRNIHFSPDTVTSGMMGFVDGPFLINNQTFHMDSVNQVIYLDDTEIWTLTNETYVAHPFHIHDIQFFVVDINGVPPAPPQNGFKDVVLVQPGDTVRFITKFERFADDSVPYMYHCHLLHHEDDGMMGTFLVIDTTSTSGISETNVLKYFKIFPNPASDKVYFIPVSEQDHSLEPESVAILNSSGQLLQMLSYNEIRGNRGLDIHHLKSGLYFIRMETARGPLNSKFIKTK